MLCGLFWGGVWLDQSSSFDLIASKRGHWDHRLTRRPRISTSSWSSWIHCLPLAALQVSPSPSSNVVTPSLPEAIGSQSLFGIYLHSPACLFTNSPKQSRTPNLNDGLFLLLWMFVSTSKNILRIKEVKISWMIWLLYWVTTCDGNVALNQLDISRPWASLSVFQTDWDWSAAPPTWCFLWMVRWPIFLLDREHC